MTSKTFLNYLKYSGIWISLGINPYHWGVSFKLDTPSDMDPAMYVVNIAMGPINIRGVLDDGSW